MQMPQQDQIALKKVEMAGMKLMYDAKTFPIFMADLKKPGPVPDKLAAAATGLMKMLNDRAHGQIPRQIILPAATMLMMEMASFMGQAGLAVPTQQDIQAAAHKLIDLVLKVFAKPAAQPAQPAAQPAQQPAPPGAQPQGLVGAAMGAA